MTLDTFITKYMGKTTILYFSIPWLVSLFERSRVWFYKTFCSFVPRNCAFFESSHNPSIAMSVINMLPEGEKKFQVFNSIVSNIVIYMMNNLSLFKTSAQVFFHNKSVFGKVTLFITTLSIRHVNKPVSLSFDFIKPSSWFSSLIFRVAFTGAVSIFMSFLLSLKYIFALFTNETHGRNYTNMTNMRQVAI